MCQHHSDARTAGLALSLVPAGNVYARPPTSTAIPHDVDDYVLFGEAALLRENPRHRASGTEPPGLAGATPRERSDVLLSSALDDDLFVDESVLKSRSEGRRWKRGDDAAQTRRVVPDERPGLARPHASRSILLSLHGSRERAPTEAPARAETPVFHLTDSACCSSRAVSRTVKYRPTLLMFSLSTNFGVPSRAALPCSPWRSDQRGEGRVGRALGSRLLASGARRDAACPRPDLPRARGAARAGPGGLPSVP